METSNNERTILSNLIRQSQNNFEIKKSNSFDDLTKLNKTINYLNQQVCFF
jgi:hypothetical protein